MEFWVDVAAGAFGSAAFLGLCGLFVKSWIDGQFTKNRMFLKDEIDRKMIASNALYKNCEQAIFAFDAAFRGLLGQCEHIVEDDFKHQSEIDHRFLQMNKYYSDLQEARFKGKLVFEEDLAKPCESLYDLARHAFFQAREAIILIAAANSWKLAGEIVDESIQWDVNDFSEARSEIRIIVGGLEREQLRIWETEARKQLRAMV
ncbi:MAG: hypothetical protein ACX94C_10865 [Phycisphaerales bacterium]